jgi:valyl-tRNA synthetase
VTKATAALSDFEYTAALEVTERFFWSFCDDYLELVKQRAYGDDGPVGAGAGAGTAGAGEAAAQSARLALRSALSVLLRLFAPFLPFCAEEAWSWWHDDSVHTSPWPTVAGLAASGPAAGGPAAAGAAAGTDADPAVITAAAAVISAIRKAKSEARLSMRAPAGTVRVTAPAADADRLRAAQGDIAAAGNVGTLVIEAHDHPDLRVDVELPEA